MFVDGSLRQRLVIHGTLDQILFVKSISGRGWYFICQLSLLLSY